MSENHVKWHNGLVSREDRERQNRHPGGLVWLTGLSASGKSTIAHNAEAVLVKNNVRAYVLDGDNVRHGLNSNLGFSRQDRRENLRRIAELSLLFVDAGMLVLAAFISPYREDRQYIRERFEGVNFLEVYVKCSLRECERRDPKGQYKKARAGIIKNYTGISSPYEAPESPDLVLETGGFDLEHSVGDLLGVLVKRGLVSASQAGL